MYLDKTERDFQIRSLDYWVYHHFNGGDYWRSDAQLNIALPFLEDDRNDLDTWFSIREAMRSLPWPVDPECLGEGSDFEGALYDYFESDDLVIEDMVLDMAVPALDAGAPWVKIIEKVLEIENSYYERSVS